MTAQEVDRLIYIEDGILGKLFRDFDSLSESMKYEERDSYELACKIGEANIRKLRKLVIR